MTIDRIEIQNFQSLSHVSLNLAPLTVIVGPSSSGKSAFIRALRTLVANRRGHDFITHGERTASISAHIASTDPLRSGTVTLTRSTATSPNAYTLIPDDPAHPLHPKAEFTKLGGDVPTPISAFLGIPTDQISLVVASQFDKPYLLDAPGTEVARTLGALTNAHIILNGSRESNRRKLTSAQTLRTRSADLEAIRSRIPEFRALKDQRSALDRAEDLLQDAYDTQRALSQVTRLTDDLTIAQQRIPALREQLASIPEPADLEEIISAFLEARKRLSRYQDTLKAIADAQRAVAARREALEAAAQDHEDAKASVLTAMQGISQGFLDYFEKHAKTISGAQIDVDEAARLSARYVAQLDS